MWGILLVWVNHSCGGQKCVCNTGDLKKPVFWFCLNSVCLCVCLLQVMFLYMTGCPRYIPWRFEWEGNAIFSSLYDVWFYFVIACIYLQKAVDCEVEIYFSGIFVVILSRISVFSRQQSGLYHIFTLVGVQKCKWLSGCLTQLSGNALHQLSFVS